MAMRRTGKRALSWLLALVMALSLLPSSALALEEGQTGEIGASMDAPPGTGSGAAEADPENTNAPDGTSDRNDATVPDAVPDQNGTAAPDKVSGQDDGQDGGTSPKTYILHLTHILRWKSEVTGDKVNTRFTETIYLTEEDFVDGVFDVGSRARVHEALTAELRPGVLRPEDFGEKREGGAQIIYTLQDGWTVRFPESEGDEGSAFRGVYEGSFDEVEFVKAGSITVTINYVYSRTGGLAGTVAHAQDVIELVLKDGKAQLENWKVPHFEESDREYHGHSHDNLRGFRVVLNPAPLDQYLVEPPKENMTAEDLAKALEDGDFNLDPEKVDADYPKAWDAARTAKVKDVNDKEVIFTYIAPTANGGTEATTSNNEAEQYTLNAENLTADTTLTIYFRRDTGTYTVKHWRPRDGVKDPDQSNKDNWAPIENAVETYQGRIGALTTAEARVVNGYKPLTFSNEVIKPDGQTEINIYYVPDDIRVIFDTDDIHIERQLVGTGEAIDFSKITKKEMDKAKAGYEFVGWQYKKKTSDKTWDWADLLLEADSTSFTLTDDFIKGAVLEESAEAAGIQVLRLRPKWEPATTSIRVTLWTEDLNGHDVEVTDTFYDFDNSQEAPEPTEGKIVHQAPGEGTFTNVGSFEMQVKTGTELVKNGELTSEVKTRLKNELDDADGSPLMGTVEVKGSSGSQTVNVSNFYDLYNQTGNPTVLVEVVDPKTGAVSEDSTGTTAAANGTTQVYVYFTRNEYTLEFHYYLLPSQIGKSDPAAYICTNTDDFHEGQYTWSDDGSVSPAKGIWCRIQLQERVENDTSKTDIYAGRTNAEILEQVPMKTTITAKYGADLRDVWPGAEDISDNTKSTRYILHSDEENDRRRVSWTPTSGLHRSLKVGNNENIPGAYSAMSPAVIANIKEPKEVNHLIAFWKQTNNNTYRYNYCYEVPELSSTYVESCSAITIYNDSNPANQHKNKVYLVPRSNDIFLKYGFTDLITADKLQVKGTSDGKLPNGIQGGDYYVIRIFNSKCYAVSRQLVALSALDINGQNPSARPNLTLVGRDYSTKEHPNWGTSITNPCDVYFCYSREPFTITYRSNANTVLGKITLPYGTRLDAEKYGFGLEQNKKESYYSDKWEVYSSDGDNPVCPGRNPYGTKDWTFKGWSLGPAGTRMMDWGDENNPVILSGNLDLYATWTAPTYTVHFNWDGGSFTEGNGDALQTQSIPANRSFVTSGQIPRPFRTGYVLNGWVITAEGTENNVVSDHRMFHFDDPIYQDLWVKANWIPSGEKEITYTVYYRYKDANGQEVDIRDSTRVTESFMPDSIVWESPRAPTVKGYENYVPLEQVGSVKLETGAGKENKIIFYYIPPWKYEYTVEFVDWDHKDAKPVCTAVVGTTSASLQVTPTETHIGELNKQGYYLVDDTGKRAERGAELARHLTLTPNGTHTATFYVLPENYSITYINLAEVIGAAGMTAYPTEYTTAKGAGKLKNPTDTYQVDGQPVRFIGWQMVDPTKEVGESKDFTDGISTQVSIDPKSHGDLIFRAVWSPNMYIVSFAPGAHGSLSGTDSFTGILAGTVLQNHTGFAVPGVTAESGWEFTGWKQTEDGNSYSTESVYGLRVHSDLHFTAQYQEKTVKPPERPQRPDPPEERPVTPPTPTEPTAPEAPVTPPPLIERPVDPDTGLIPYDPAIIIDDIVPLAAPHLNVTDHYAYLAGYPNGTVRPEGSITRAEVATIFFRLMLTEYRQENWSTENDFPDVASTIWYNNAVSTCVRAGLLSGYPDGTFRPNAPITRAEFAAIAARFLSEEVPGYDYFTDMEGHWARTDVARAVVAGWIKGDGRIFRPDDNLTRAEAVTLVNRMIERFPDQEHLLPNMIVWPDNLESAWYYEAVQEATNSHDYEAGDFTFAEIWTSLLANRDWAELEKEWATAASAPGGEVAPDLFQNGEEEDQLPEWLAASAQAQ